MYHFSGHARGLLPQRFFSFIALAPEGRWQQCFVRRCAWVGGWVMSKLLFLQSKGWEDRKPSKYIIIVFRLFSILPAVRLQKQQSGHHPPTSTHLLTRYFRSRPSGARAMKVSFLKKTILCNLHPQNGFINNFKLFW